MLAIRLQRKGRRGHAQFRLIAQDKRFSPVRGRIVAYLGSYDPHTKMLNVDSKKIDELLKNGAQPSPRAIYLLEKEGIKLPSWVTKPAPKKLSIKNPEKLRKNRPADAEPKVEAKPEGQEAASPAEDSKAGPDTSKPELKSDKQAETSEPKDADTEKKTEAEEDKKDNNKSAESESTKPEAAKKEDKGSKPEKPAE